jgi:hypothetical protein
MEVILACAAARCQRFAGILATEKLCRFALVQNRIWRVI